MVNSADNAIYEVKKRLFQDFKILITKERWIDHNRKCILTSKGGVQFFCLFKREFFNSFGTITGQGGMGESLNVRDFDYAVYERGIEQFLYVYPDKKIYKIRAIDLRKNSVTYKNESDGRDQYLFPVRLLQRLA